MKLFQLQYFCAACLHKNITRAAEALHVSQPSVTHAIQSLEREFGLPLLDRGGRGFALTPDGEYLYRESRSLLGRGDALLEAMAERKRLGAAVLRFGSTPMVGAGVPQSVYRALGGGRGALSVHLVEGSRPRLLSLIDENLLDFALMPVGDLPGEDYGVLELFSREIVFCVRRPSPLARLKTIRDAGQIAGVPLAMLGGKSYFAGMVFDYFRRRGVTPNVVCYAAQIFTVLEFVESGAAAAILSRGVSASRRRIAEIPFAEPMALRTGFVWKKSSPGAKETESEVRRLAEALRGQEA